MTIILIRDRWPKGQSWLPRDPTLSEVDTSETATMKVIMRRTPVKRNAMKEWCKNELAPVAEACRVMKMQRKRRGWGGKGETDGGSRGERRLKTGTRRVRMRRRRRR